MTTKLNFTQINALAKPELEVFTNSFSYHDDDYFHKNIGSLFGVIQVTDHSKNSEYLPNLLTSILKKTFYSNNHKTTEQNFEIALKKANLALADLAESDIVEWNKNLHAIIGVLHKDTLLFTQVGNALISIGRGDKIMHLSEPDTSTPHPIKTFQDIVVGKVELGDKIVLSTPTISDIFQPDDINRLFKTFSAKEFDDIFFKTLKKEGENISAVVVNVETEEQLDYSKSKSLGSEDLPIEELTKNKNFLGEDVKTKKAKDKTGKHADKPLKTSAGRIKKSTSINEPAQIEKPDLILKESPSADLKKDVDKNKTTKVNLPQADQQSGKIKKELSKKQALDVAQREAQESVKRKASRTQKGDQKTGKIPSKKIPTKSVGSLPKTAKIVNTSVDKQLDTTQKNTKFKTTNIKSISSSTGESETKPKSLKKKPTRKLNDLKDPEEKKNLPDISPFEEMQDIYIKDDASEEKTKNPRLANRPVSSKKLKEFFYTPNPNEKNTTSSRSTKLDPPGDLGSKPVKELLNTPGKRATASFTKENFKESPSSKHTPHSAQKMPAVNFSKYSKKIKSLASPVGKTILNLSKSGMSSLGNLRNKSTKTSSESSQTSPPQETNSMTHSPRVQQGIGNKKQSATLVKSFASKAIALIQLLLGKTIKLFQLLLKKSAPFAKKYRTPILILLFIILVPVIIGFFTKSKQNEETVDKLKLPEAPIVTTAKPIIEDKNQVRKILSLPTEIKLLAGNDDVLIAYTTDSQLYEIDKKTNKSSKLSLPSDTKLSDIKAIDYIGSLNLFFLSSDTVTVSYSPKVKKFISNNITLPTGFKLAGQNTYLSYLYLLDSSSKQIYRYPRATGGFDVSKKWLADPLVYDAEVSAMAIDENVRVAYLDGTVEKYSRGKLEGTKKFELKSLDFIETTEDLKSYYLLSKKDGKILKVNKVTDKIEKEYQNSAIQNTTTFTVDEKLKLIHLFDGKELLSIDL